MKRLWVNRKAYKHQSDREAKHSNSEDASSGERRSLIDRASCGGDFVHMANEASSEREVLHIFGGLRGWQVFFVCWDRSVKLVRLRV